MRHHKNRTVQEQISQIVRFGLRSNAPVEIGHGMIWVSGQQLESSSHGGVVFVVLADRARLGKPTGATAKDILEFSNERRSQFMSWNWSLPASTAAVNTAVYDLRRALKNAELDPKIIETLAHQFYRLSVPSVNIIDHDAAPPANVAA